MRFPILILLAVLISACNTSDQTNEVLKEVIPTKQLTYRLNKPEDIRRLGIKKMVLQNCLQRSGCFKDYFEFNDCGKVMLHSPPMIASIFTYEYDDSCRLVSSYDGRKDDWRSWTNYQYGDDGIVLEIDAYDLDTIHRDTNKIKVVDNKPLESCRYDSLGKEIECTMGKLLYPCGIVFPGKHRLEYHYHTNGLRDYVQYFDSTGKVVVEEEYIYYGTDTIPLDFTVSSN